MCSQWKTQFDLSLYKSNIFLLVENLYSFFCVVKGLLLWKIYIYIFPVSLRIVNKSMQKCFSCLWVAECVYMDARYCMPISGGHYDDFSQVSLWNSIKYHSLELSDVFSRSILGAWSTIIKVTGDILYFIHQYEFQTREWCLPRHSFDSYSCLAHTNAFLLLVLISFTVTVVNELNVCWIFNQTSFSSDFFVSECKIKCNYPW